MSREVSNGYGDNLVYSGTDQGLDIVDLAFWVLLPTVVRIFLILMKVMKTKQWD